MIKVALNNIRKKYTIVKKCDGIPRRKFKKSYKGRIWYGY